MFPIDAGTLLKVISTGDSAIIMARPTGPLWAVRFFALLRDVAPIESFESNLLVLEGMGPGRCGGKEE